MKVQLEHETTERRMVHGCRTNVTVWKPAWKGEVLYADRRFILVRSAGAHQTFGGIPGAKWRREGIRSQGWGFQPRHPDVVRLTSKRVDKSGKIHVGRLRISPASAEALAKRLNGIPTGWLHEYRTRAYLSRED